MSSAKINVYSLADLKNTTDDALPNYLTSLRFRQSHTHSNVRLALGYSAVLIGTATFYFDWTLGWAATKYWTAWAVGAYFALNGAFTWWMWAVEKGLVFEGEREGAQVMLYSRSPKYDPTYDVTARWRDGPAAPWRHKQCQAQFTRWFTGDGFFVAKPFQQWLASEVPVVGAADPGNVVSKKAMDALADGSSSGSAGGKGARSRKKG